MKVQSGESGESGAEPNEAEATEISPAATVKEWTEFESSNTVVLHHRLELTGDKVRAGDRLVDGALIPHDILRISGIDKLQEYLLNEVQGVYRSQSVPIDDRHIEILIRQMMRKVQINDPGDTEFLPTDVISKNHFQDRNTEMISEGKRPATASPQLLGIARASLQAESWIAAASFQETTKVLTEAAIAGRRDELMGLKENVILGHIIPAGTGNDVTENHVHHSRRDGVSGLSPWRCSE